MKSYQLRGGRNGLAGEARQTPPLPRVRAQMHSMDETRRSRGTALPSTASAEDQWDFTSKYKGRL